MDAFTTAYKGLNVEQKRAVDTIDGPVMVIAGPGTGKTQVLALRIAHILKQTDTPPDGVLCLTFTNAGVKAMRERLLQLIGPTATRVKISTFHGYGLELIETYFGVLGFETVPALLDDATTIVLFDDILFSREWTYIRPRSNSALYYYDLKSLISTLKRDNISPDAFAAAITADIKRIENDPKSISSRGETKGQLKKDVEKKIESLQRSLEAATFYAMYEAMKLERNQIDFNDVLALMVRIAKESDDAAASIRERFLYVLIDEHQDSSGIQNAFLQEVWGSVEQPNIFVVGDDRQLIYGFGGASLAYFEGFKHTFGTATLITLTHNYRSTQTILDAAESLLTSTLAQGKLIGSTEEKTPLQLVVCDYPRDEIIAAGLAIKKHIAEGMNADDCAILVPKNRQVKTAVTILKSMGLPVAAGASLNLFELSDTQSLLNIFRILINPHDALLVSRSLLDPLATIDPLGAHNYLYEQDARKLSVATLIDANDEQIARWGSKLSQWLTLAQATDAYGLIQTIGGELLLNQSTDDETVRRRVEIIRTLLHLAMSQIEKGLSANVSTFIAFIDRLIEYGEDIPLAVFGASKGVKILTLHGSKGLEFESVWIAHMDERSFMSQKRGGFVLPESINQQETEAAEEVAKRQLYVAITRAKKFCTISYAQLSHAGTDQKLASIIEALPSDMYTRQSHDQTEKALLAAHAYDVSEKEIQSPTDLADIVKETYTDRKVSVTMLNNFFECPWKWYFRNLLQLPEPMTESLQVGNVTHKVIEYILSKKGNDVSESGIEKYIKLSAETESRYDDGLAERLVHQVRPIIDTWMKTYLSSITAPYDIEQNLTYRDPDFAHLTITGKIDLVEEIITGEVRVTDWKTGSPKTSGDIEKNDENNRMSGLLRQLVMYSYLIDGHSHGDKTITESRLIFLEAKKGDKNSIQARSVTKQDIERLKTEIKEYDELLKTGEWMHQKCIAKQYRDGEMCAYCQLARRIYNS